MRARWMLVVGLPAALTAGLFVSVKGPSLPTWAEMAERFKAQKCVGATIYSRSGSEAQPEETELWLRSSGIGRARMRQGATMIFAEEGGRLAGAFDLQTHKPTNASPAAAACLTRAIPNRAFVLDDVLSAIAGGPLPEGLRAAEAVEAPWSGEVTFEIQSQTSSDLIVVWMDLLSKLPVRMVLKNRDTGAYTEAVFTYTNDQHDRFFDPAVYRNAGVASHE